MVAGHDGVSRFPADFPSNLRVLLVDDDLACLAILKKMLEECSYHVIACQSGEEAMGKLKNSKDGFDIIMSDVRMPEIGGLQLLEKIATMKIDSPIILFSDEPDTETVLKGVHGGACDFLAKPIHISTLKMIWKHLLHKTGKERAISGAPIASLVLHFDSQSNEQLDYNALNQKRGSDSTDSGNSIDRSSLKENEQGQSNVTDAATTKKKPRMSWKTEAHNAFLEAISSLPPQQVLPKKILDYMEAKHGITGLTRQIIASHLQKHRDSVKKLGNGILGDPRISSQATGYGARAPPPLPTLSQNLHSTACEMWSRHQALTAQLSMPQIPWNPGVRPMTREQLYPGVGSINSTIQATPTNIYSTGTESPGQQLPLGNPCGVYNSDESCRSNVLPLPQEGEFMDHHSMPETTPEQEVAEWLNGLFY
ncbi:hypothetical protein MLD38_027403 [Melastoma candidum]|uniref:Uncharacterized protein n=1 Tax=Melastoma candidum TaxID=119954 RepID=A0ACB9P2Q1_9MYRT|nr:hypothetical protein MLD38_027403 [Melastoma candidum]